MKMLSNNYKAPKKIQSVDRVLDILEYIARNHNIGRLTNISQDLGLNKSTVYTLISTLEQRDYIQQNQETGKYSLGLKFFELGEVVKAHMDLPKIVQPYLDELVKKYEETAHLAVLSQREVVYIAKIDSPHSIRMISHVGGRNYCHNTGVGKVLLAGLSERQRDALLNQMELVRCTENTITDPDILRQELDKIRVQGYAFDLEEIEIGLWCVAAPIRNHNGKVIAAISLSAPTNRISCELLMTEIKDDVVAVADKISENLGYHI